MQPYLFSIALILAVLGAYGGGAALSVAMGFVAVVVPQIIALIVLQKRGAGRAFNVWTLKFSLSLLLLAVSVRLLHTMALLDGLMFVVGTVVGVVANIVVAVRSYRRFDEASA